LDAPLSSVIKRMVVSCILYFIASASLFSVDVFVAFVVGEDRIAATVKIVLVLQPRQTN